MKAQHPTFKHWHRDRREMELWRANVIAACRTVLESNVYNEEDDGQEAADARRRASESIKYIFWTLIEEITDEANHGRSPDDDIE